MNTHRALKALWLVVGIVSVPLLSVAELTNPGFDERPFSGWLLPWGGGSEQSRGDGYIIGKNEGEHVRSGDGAVRLVLSDEENSGGNAWCGVTQLHPCVPGKHVRAEAWVYSASDRLPLRAEARTFLKVEYFTDEDCEDHLAGKDVVGKSFRVSDAAALDKWHLLELDAVAPDGARGLKLSIVLVGENLTGEPQGLWVDDAYLEVEGLQYKQAKKRPDRLAVPEVLLARGSFYRDGEPFWVKGVGYQPCRPGTVPSPDAYKSKEILREDMKRIRAAGFNTLRTWGAMPDHAYELAAEQGLQVLTGAPVPLGDFSDPTLHEHAANVVKQTIGRLRKHPNIIGYFVGNEPEVGIFDEAKPEDIQAFFKAVLDAAHEADPLRPVSFTPWILMWFVDASQWDFFCYNAYNYFPSAVSTNLGYARFIDYARREQANGRPFIITEFGYPVNPTGAGGFAYGGNSLEEQAQGVVDIFDWIVAGGGQGGCIFEWNDEWWKSANTRNDEKTHDDDPEEYFGLLAFTGPRDMTGKTRPAYDAVTEYFDLLVLEPRQGAIYTGNIPVQVYQDDGDESWSYEYAIDGGAWQELRGEGSWWLAEIDRETLDNGPHEMIVRAGEDRQKTVTFGVADVSETAEHTLTMSASPQGEPGSPVPVKIEVRDREGKPVPDYPVRLSVLHTRPQTDTFYSERTGAQGRLEVLLFPGRDVDVSHLVAWASCDTTRAGLPAYAAADVAVRVRGKPGHKPESYQCTIRRAPHAPVVDGKREDAWGDVPTIDLSLPESGAPTVFVGGPWLGNRDLSGQVYCLWDEEAVYLLAEIVDDDPGENEWTKADIWRGDGIEVFLGTDADLPARDAYSPSDFQIILAPEGKTWVYGQAQGGTRDKPLQDAEMAYLQTDKGYVLELRVPWANFVYAPVGGERLRLEIHLNDFVEGQGVPTKMMWATTKDAFWTPRHWGYATLSAEPPSETKRSIFGRMWGK